MSKIIKYEMTWCEYLTPCPFNNKSGNPAGIMVGDWECSQCKYYDKRSDNMKERKIYCNFKKN